jgi:hypothetical protein
VIAILFATSAAYPAKKHLQGTLTLSCDGTRETTYYDASYSKTSEPIKNMGLVIDYGTHRVDSVFFSVTFDVGAASISSTHTRRVVVLELIFVEVSGLEPLHSALAATQGPCSAAFAFR